MLKASDLPVASSASARLLMIRLDLLRPDAAAIRRLNWLQVAEQRRRERTTFGVLTASMAEWYSPTVLSHEQEPGMCAFCSASISGSCTADYLRQPKMHLKEVRVWVAATISSHQGS